VPRFAYEKSVQAIRTKFPESSHQLQGRLQPAYARLTPRQPISRAAAIRQARSRQFSTRAGGFVGSIARSGLRSSAKPAQSSRIGSIISRLTSHSPFTSSLRPNLTGGAVARTAGGYAVGAGRVGGARYFSHGPAAPAQVVNNVSAAMRGFLLSGQKARFDGIDPRTGEKRFKTVTFLQDQTQRRIAEIPRNSPGSHIDFQLAPIITALSGLEGIGKDAESDTLNAEGLMDMLSVDLARALKEFAAVINDLKRLGTLGDLPVSLHDRSTVRVRFPGCDAEQVERLCDEVGVERGRVFQDEDFEIRNGTELALLFPFAPSMAPSPETELFLIHEDPRAGNRHELDWRLMMSGETSPGISNEIQDISFEDVGLFEKNPWTSPSGYSSIGVSELGGRAFFPEQLEANGTRSVSDYEGVQGIYKFLEQCDQAADHGRY
jgi:hypothetical protein